MVAKGKVTTATLQQRKADGDRIAALTAYDHLFANLLDAAGIDVILVGDSVAQLSSSCNSPSSTSLHGPHPSTVRFCQ